MDQKRNTLAGKSQSKVVLIIALLLSLISLSGQAIYQSNKHHSVKTEQIISNNKFSKSKTTTIAFHFENLRVTTYFNRQELSVLLAHSRSVKISLEHVNRDVLTFRKPTGFFVFSDVSHRSDEDDQILTAG